LPDGSSWNTASAAPRGRAVEIARRIGDQAGVGICPVGGAAAGERVEGGQLLCHGFARQQDRGNERRRDERRKPAESQIAPAVMQFHRRPSCLVFSDRKSFGRISQPMSDDIGLSSRALAGGLDFSWRKA
jgi:hypothetical protein